LSTARDYVTDKALQTQAQGNGCVIIICCPHSCDLQTSQQMPAKRFLVRIFTLLFGVPLKRLNCHAFLLSTTIPQGKHWFSSVVHVLNGYFLDDRLMRNLSICVRMMELSHVFRPVHVNSCRVLLLFLQTSKRLFREETAESILFEEFLASGFPPCLSMRVFSIELRSPVRMLFSGRKKFSRSV